MEINNTIHKENNKTYFGCNKFFLKDEEYKEIEKIYPKIEDVDILNIGVKITKNPSIFINNDFVDPNATFFDYVKQEVIKKKKQEQINSIDVNNLGNNENELEEAQNELEGNNKIEEKPQKEENNFTEKKEYLKNILLKYAEICEKHTIYNDNGEMMCNAECPFLNQNTGECLLKENNPLSQEKVATILMIYHSRSKNVDESAIFKYVNDKIKDLTEEEKELLRESI